MGFARCLSASNSAFPCSFRWDSHFFTASSKAFRSGVRGVATTLHERPSLINCSIPTLSCMSLHSPQISHMCRKAPSDHSHPIPRQTVLPFLPADIRQSRNRGTAPSGALPVPPTLNDKLPHLLSTRQHLGHSCRQVHVQ